MEFEFDLNMIDELGGITLCTLCTHYHECEKGQVCKLLKKYFEECD